MRSPFHSIPSLPIFWILSWILLCDAAVRADQNAGVFLERSAPVERDILGRKNLEAHGSVVSRDLENGLIERAPLPRPKAKAYPNPQSNYYAFSGAIYIVGGSGQTLNAASPAYCPATAPQGCGNIGVYNWCCGSGYTCAWGNAAQSVVGCCPSGQTCTGTVDQSQITTVTVYITTTQYGGPATVVAVNGVQTTTTVAAVAGRTTAPVQYNGYCTTIYAKGGNLPTTANALCGTALVLNVGVRPVAREVLGLVLGFWFSLGIVWAGFGVKRW